MGGQQHCKVVAATSGTMHGSIGLRVHVGQTLSGEFISDKVCIFAVFVCTIEYHVTQRMIRVECEWTDRRSYTVVGDRHGPACLRITLGVLKVGSASSSLCLGARGLVFCHAFLYISIRCAESSLFTVRLLFMKTSGKHIQCTDTTII